MYLTRFNSFIDFIIKKGDKRDGKVKLVTYFSLLILFIHTINSLILIRPGGTDVCVECMGIVYFLVFLPIVSYWFNYDKLSKILFCLGLPIATCLFSSSSENGFGAELVYFPFLFLTFFLIENFRDRALIALVYLGCYFFIHNKIDLFGLNSSSLSAEHANFIKNLTYLGSFTIVFVCCQYFFSAIKSFRSSTNKLLNNLRDQNEKLEGANVELERFNYIASHDLKSPLRNISSFINLMERDLKKENYNNLTEYLGFIKSGSNNMYQLIEDILKYSKIKDVSQREKVKLSLNNLCEQLNQIYNGQIKYENLPSIYESPHYIKTIFQNLIENGLKYNKSEHPQVKISYKQHQNHFLLTFVDNGIGMDPAYFDQIFEMFKRLHSKSEYEGTGIGLAIVKRISEQMKAEISLKSEVGIGTEFTIKLPNSCLCLDE